MMLHRFAGSAALTKNYAIRTLMAQAATHAGHDPDLLSIVAALRIAGQTIANQGAFPLSRDRGLVAER